MSMCVRVPLFPQKREKHQLIAENETAQEREGQTGCTRTCMHEWSVESSSASSVRVSVRWTSVIAVATLHSVLSLTLGLSTAVHQQQHPRTASQQHIAPTHSTRL